MKRMTRQCYAQLQTILFTAVLMIGVIQNSFAEEQDQLVTLPFQPEIGDTVRYQVRKGRTFAGHLRRPNASAQYVISITYKGKQHDGHVYTLTYEDMRFEQPDPRMNAQIHNDPKIQQITKLFEGKSIEYLADETGFPLAVRDLEKIRSTIVGPGLDLLDVDEAVRTLFMQQDAESMAQTILMDVAPIFYATGAQFPENKPVEFEQTVPWHLTGIDLVSNTKTELLSIKNDVASLISQSGYTRESLEAGMVALLENLDVPQTPEKKEEFQAAIKAMESFDTKTTYRAEIPLATNWPHLVFSISKVNVTEDENSFQGTTTYEATLIRL